MTMPGKEALIDSVVTYAVFALGQSLFALYSVLVSGAKGQVPATIIVTVRALAASIIFNIIGALDPKCRGFVAAHGFWPPWRDFLKIVGVGVLVVVINAVFFTLGAQLTNPLTATAIGCTVPIPTMIFGALLGSERLTRLKMVTTIVVLAGAAVCIRVWNISANGSNFALGCGALVLNVLAYSGYMVGIKGLMVNYPLMHIQRLFMPVCSVILVILSASINHDGYRKIFAGELNSWGWIVLGYAAFVLSAIPHTLVAYGISRSNAVIASLTANLQPIFAGILGYFVLGNSVTLYQGVGAAIIIAGVVLSSVHDLLAPPAKPNHDVTEIDVVEAKLDVVASPSAVSDEMSTPIQNPLHVRVDEST